MEPDRAPECPRCEQPMERGYMVDHSYGSAYPTAWVEGHPEWSRWSGLRLKGKVKVPVTTFRCPQCGRLESFAWPGKWPA